MTRKNVREVFIHGAVAYCETQLGHDEPADTAFCVCSLVFFAFGQRVTSSNAAHPLETEPAEEPWNVENDRLQRESGSR